MTIDEAMKQLPEGWRLVITITSRLVSVSLVSPVDRWSGYGVSGGWRANVQAAVKWAREQAGKEVVV